MSEGLFECGLGARLLAGPSPEKLLHFLVELGNIAGLPAGHSIAIHDSFGINPLRAGIHQIIPNRTVAPGAQSSPPILRAKTSHIVSEDMVLALSLNH